MNVRLLVAAVLLVCTAAAANELPELPRLPQPGSKLELLEKASYRCEESDYGVKCRRDGRKGDILEGEQAIEIVLVYRRGILVRSVVAIDEQRFRLLAARISNILGTASTGEEALNAGMGGTFSNEYYVWRSGGHAWFLEQFFERVISSGLWIMSDDEFDALMNERDKSRVRGVRNL